jgi:hypothetical protein
VAISHDVDRAVIERLAGDAELTALMPDGVYFEPAPLGAKACVVVALTAHEDAYVFGGAAWELFTYSIEALELETSADHAGAAEARIKALMQDGPLTPAGYAVMNVKRYGYFHLIEVDDGNATRWQHCGANYQVMVQPTA